MVFTLFWLGLPTCEPLFGPTVNHYAVLLVAGLFLGSGPGEKDARVRLFPEQGAFSCRHCSWSYCSRSIHHRLGLLCSREWLADRLLAIRGDTYRIGSTFAVRGFHTPPTVRLKRVKSSGRNPAEETKKQRLRELVKLTP